jgi:hypothetical protein
MVGQEDEECLLGICIIEGRFEGNDQAYAVSVGPHYANVLKCRFGLSEEEFETQRFIL